VSAPATWTCSAEDETEAGLYLRLLYHSTLGLREMKKKKKDKTVNNMIPHAHRFFFFFFFTLVTSPRRSLSLKLSDTKVYEPQIRAHVHHT